MFGSVRIQRNTLAQPDDRADEVLCPEALVGAVHVVVNLLLKRAFAASEIATLTREILERGHHLFLCTDGTLIRRWLHMIPPYTNFFWNVKLDGTEAAHDGRAKRPGQFVEALDGIKAAKNAGFFVLVTSTIYPDTDVSDLRVLYERLHDMHVDGYLLSPHYPEQKLCRDGSANFHEKMHQRFREASERLKLDSEKSFAS